MEVFWVLASIIHMLTEFQGSLLVDHFRLRPGLETVDMSQYSLNPTLIFLNVNNYATLRSGAGVNFK